MDTFLAITSRRDVKQYGDAALPPATVARILDAGRLSGSARNRQPWRFLILETEELREAMARAVYAPENVRTAALVIAVAGHGQGPVGFDCGRAAQNMLLAAWNEGVGATPNGIADQDAAAALLGLGEDERLQIVLSFGYPARERDPSSRTSDEWSAAANRKPLVEISRTI